MGRDASRNVAYPVQRVLQEVVELHTVLRQRVAAVEPLRELTDGHAGRACQFLRDKFEQLQRYTKHRIEWQPESGGGRRPATPVQRSQAPQTSPSPNADELVQRLGAITNLNPERWAQLTPELRVDTLRQVESSMADAFGRTKCGIRIGQFAEQQAGAFIAGQNVIQISDNVIGQDDPLEALRTVLHEGRHAYQWQACRTPGFHHNELEVREWKANFKNYRNAEIHGMDEYYMQPLERDAFNFEAIASRFYEVSKE